MFVLRCVRLCVFGSRGGRRRTPLPRYSSVRRANYANLQEEPQLCGAAATKRFCHTDFADLYKNESVQRYLQQLMEEYGEVSDKLQYAHLSDSERKLLMKKRTKLLPLANIFHKSEQALKYMQEISSILDGSSGAKEEDAHLKELLKEEEAQICHKILTLRRDLIKALVPTDPLDSSNIVLEVVSGRTTGGDICQQFTREMFEMYQGFARFKNWEFEIINYTPSDVGGLHHAAVTIQGDSVYRHLKHEGGTHRVQRIPEVGLSSRMQRIHTGTMTVIVLTQPIEFDITIDPKELRIDTFRARGAGGQSVNTTDSAVRIVHLPTGITAECQQARSQLKNRDTAMRVLKARIYHTIVNEENEKRHTARRKQVGTRAQSERIRTYNFSQDRVTDHRTGYVTRDIKELMRGGQAFNDLISEVLEHTEREVLLEKVQNSSILQQP